MVRWSKLIPVDELLSGDSCLSCQVLLLLVQLRRLRVGQIRVRRVPVVVVSGQDHRTVVVRKVRANLGQQYLVISLG